VNLAAFRPCQEKSNSNPVGTSLCHAPRTVAQCSSPRAPTQKSVGERAISDRLLANFPLGFETLAEAWKGRRQEKDVARAIKILDQKFGSVNAFGPAQVVEFLAPANREAGEIEARRAFELVQAFLNLLG
jgi:hypothetical protein